MTKSPVTYYDLPQTPSVMQEFSTAYSAGSPTAFAADSPDLYRDLKNVRSGLPFRSFENLATDLALPDATLCKALAIPVRTLTRRKKEDHFSLTESNQIRRVERVFQLALEALGEKEEARQWLKAPQPGLRNERPLDLLDVEPGARLVEDHLGRIMEGVYW